ncbi:unnamed protein product, partial [marine sediment metagenome]
MFNKLKDELLKEKIEEMDDLDRIQLQNKLILYESISVSGSYMVIPMVFLAAVMVLIPSIHNLALYGFDYS